MLGLLRLLYWILFGKGQHFVILADADDSNMFTHLVHVGVQTDEVPADDCGQQRSNQSVGDIIQVVNLSPENTNSNERDGIENQSRHKIEININPTASDHVVEDETRQEPVQSSQIMGNVVQLVGDLTDLSKSSVGYERISSCVECLNDSDISQQLVEDGSKSGGGFHQMASNTLNIGNMDSESTKLKSKESSELIEENKTSTLPYFQQNFHNSINIKESPPNGLVLTMEEFNNINCKLEQHMSIKTLTHLVNDVQSQLHALRCERRHVGVDDDNTGEGDDRFRSRFHPQDQQLLSSKTREKEMTNQLHEVISAYHEMKEEIFNLNLDHKMNIDSVRIELNELESKLDKIAETLKEHEGTFRVTEEDMEGMALEWENRLYENS